MAKLSIIDNDNLRYINTRYGPEEELQRSRPRQEDGHPEQAGV
jgi:hypothetical protein